MIRWTFIVFVASVALILGFWGFMEEFPVGDPAGSSTFLVILNNLWRTLALFFFETDPAWGADNVKLVSARLLAPVAAVGAIIEIALKFFGEKITLLRARGRRNHTIIVGCGERGQYFLLDCQSHSDDKPVVIDCSNDPIIVQRAREAGALFIQGDARNAALLEKAGLKCAQQLIILGGDDAQNLEVLAAAHSVMREEVTTLSVLVRIDNSLLVRQLDQADDFARKSGLNVTAFNLSAATARRFFEEYPLVDHAELRAQGRVHLVCIGWTPFLFEVLEQLARLSPFCNFPQPRVDLFVPNRNAVRSELDAVQPAIWGILHVELHNLDDVSCIPTAEQMKLVEPGPRATVTAVLVSIGPDADAAAAAFAIRERSQQNSRWRAPVFVHLKAHSALSSLIEQRPGAVDPGKAIIAVGFQADVCRGDAIAGKREELAQRIHNSYLAFRGMNDSASEFQRAENEQPWESLKQSYRLACRRAADHFPIKILSIGATHHAAPSIASANLGFASLHEQLEMLSELEHKSWEIDRRLDGWRPGTHRDNQARIHPALIPYEKLSEELKDFDRDQIRAIAKHLLKEGDAPTIKREYRLGIFGHNRVTHGAKMNMLGELDRSVMPGLIHTHQHDFVSVCTPLAPGTDTILTEAVLEHLQQSGIDHRLIVIRTLPLETVIDDFEVNFIKGVEWRLTEKVPPSHVWSEVKKRMAEHLGGIPLAVPKAYVTDLIPPGLAIDDFQADEAQKIRAYRRAAAWLVERCDILIAYHDPDRSAGPGGTRETLQWAREENSVPPDLSTLNLGEKVKKPRLMIIEP